MATAQGLSASDPTTAPTLLREIEPPELPRGWAGLAFAAPHSGVSVSVLDHPDVARRASFSPDGARVVIASFDKTVRIWNADGTGDPLVLRGHTDAIYGAAFSPDGSRLVTASNDGTARVWPELTPLRSPDDAPLWTATSYCLPAERRIELLRATDRAALAELRACQRRVAAAHAAAFGRP